MKTSVPELVAAAVQIIAGAPRRNGGEPDVSALLSFLGKNKYPLLALSSDHTWQELWASPEFKSARENEGNLLSVLRAEYISVRDRWVQAGIPCLLIKSGGYAPSFPYTSDNLDVLVKEEHWERASAILRELGYFELKNLEEPKKFLFRKLKGGEYVTTIHLHTQVAWLVGFMDDASLWQRSCVASDDEAVIHPSPEDVILITVAHSLYENKYLGLADIVKIRECWRRNKIDWKYLERVARERGWLDGLHFCLLVCAHLEKTLWGKTSVPMPALRDWEASLKYLPLVKRYYRQIIRRSSVSMPFAISFLFSKLLYYRKILRDRNHSLVRRLWHVIHTLLHGVKLKAKIRSQPSLLVSFSGPDGSGKTYHAQALMVYLRFCGLKVNYYWNRTGTSIFMILCSSVAKTLLGNRVEVKGKHGVAGRRERLRNPLLRFMWSYIAVADILFSYLLQVQLPILLGKIVLCDRYIFDAAVEMECSLMPSDRLSRLAIKLMLALTPKPDLAYLLDIPDEVYTQRRDDDTDIDYRRWQRKAYAELAQRYRLRVKRTDRGLNTVTNEIASEVITPYLDNFKTLLNRLFLSNPNQLNKRER